MQHYLVNTNFLVPEKWDGTWEHLENKLNNMFPKYTFKIKTDFNKEGLITHGNISLYASSYELCSISCSVLNLYQAYIMFVDFFIKTMNKASINGEPLMEALLKGTFKGWNVNLKLNDSINS